MNKILKLYNEDIQILEKVLYNVTSDELVKEIVENSKESLNKHLNYFLFYNKNEGRDTIFRFTLNDERLYLRVNNHHENYIIYMSQGLYINVPMLNHVSNPEEYVERLMNLEIKYGQDRFRMSDLDFDFGKFNGV